MFHSTLPQGVPDLMRASEFRRYLDELERSAGGTGRSSRLGEMSESLVQDLMRFEHSGQHGELLEVLAACLRHTEALAIYLQWGERVATLSVFPTHRLAYCAVPIEQVLAGRIAELSVLQVERATLRAPGDPETTLVGEPALYRPLGPALWAIALRGPREELLPEISGQAAYRVAPGVDLSALPMPAVLASCVNRLRRQTCNLREICAMPGIDRPRAMRLLNALYLQAGLIVSRTHPAATNEGWFGYR
jgi:hypothetical protein